VDRIIRFPVLRPRNVSIVLVLIVASGEGLFRIYLAGSGKISVRVRNSKHC
jgi:hypothetical protein